MALKANPQYRHLKRWCSDHLTVARPFQKKLFRVAGPRYTSPTNLAGGIGGFKASGRWCRRGVSRVLYLSESPETAMFEANARARRFKLPLWEQMPKVIVAIELKARSLLDLTDPALVSALPDHLSTACIADDWDAENSRGLESLSQALGRAALAAGFDALRVPSHAHPGHVNVVAFLPPKTAARSLLLNPEILEELGKN